MSKLNEATRDHLANQDFAFPHERKEPIHDAAHVRNAIVRFRQVKNVSEPESDTAGAHSDYGQQAWCRIG